MREIKFRAFDKEADTPYMSNIDLNGYQLHNYLTRPMRYEVMQYTGLKDCKAQEVYDGDILRRPAGKDAWDENNFVAYEVFWHDNDSADNHIGWQINRHHFHGNLAGTSDFIKFLPRYVKELTIIGNIHENPELLK